MGSLNMRAEARLKRKKRVGKSITVSSDRPRLSVFRSARHIYAQITDDSRGHTIAAASSVEKTVKEKPRFENKIAVSTFIGKLIAERALSKGITKVVFDRNGFLYHGRVKAVCEAAREAGLEI